MFLVEKSRGSFRLVQLKWGVYWKKREIKYNGDPRTWRFKALLQGLRSWELEGVLDPRSLTWPWTLYSDSLLFSWYLLLYFLASAGFLPLFPGLSVIAFASIIFHIFGLYWLTIAIPVFHCLFLFEKLFYLFCFFNFWERKSNWASSLFSLGDISW